MKICKKNLFFLISIILFVALISISCNRKGNLGEKKLITIATTINPNLNFALYLEKKFPLKYSVKILRSPAEVIATLKNETADVFLHSILGYIKAYKRGFSKNYKIYSPYIYKAIYFISRKNIKTTEDISFLKKIYIAYKNGSPDLMFKNIIKENKISTINLKIIYQKPLLLYKLFLNGKIDNVILMEFFVSKILEYAKNKNFYIYSLDAFSKHKNIPLAAIIFRNDLSQKDKHILINDIKKTISKINNNPKEFAKITSDALRDYQISLPEKVIYSSIKEKRLEYKIPKNPKKELYKLEALGIPKKLIDEIILTQ